MQLQMVVPHSTEGDGVSEGGISMPPWTQNLVAWLAVVAQIVVVAVSWGVLRTETTANKNDVDALKKAIEVLTDRLGVVSGRDGTTDFRIAEVERNTTKIDDMTRELQSFRGAQEVENRNFTAGIERLTRSVEGTQRQLATFVAELRTGRKLSPFDTDTQ